MDVTAYYDFKPVVQGTDWERTFEFKTNGVVNDLTGWDAKMTFRDKPHVGGRSILDLTTAATPQGSIITISASTGLVSPSITDVDLDGFDAGIAYWDLKMISPSSDGSKEYVPLRGTLPIISKVTV